MATVFVNPQNGYRESVSSLAFLWCLLFGPFYFAYKGVWRHAIIGAIAGFCTLGFSWLLYPFFAHGIVSNHYWRQGWKNLEQYEAGSGSGGAVSGPI